MSFLKNRKFLAFLNYAKSSVIKGGIKFPDKPLREDQLSPFLVVLGALLHEWVANR